MQNSTAPLHTRNTAKLETAVIKTVTWYIDLAGDIGFVNFQFDDNFYKMSEIQLLLFAANQDTKCVGCTIIAKGVRQLDCSIWQRERQRHSAAGGCR